MKLHARLLLLGLISLVFFACEEGMVEPEPGIQLTEKEQAYIDLLDNEVSPISNSPLRLKDADLRILDRLADTKMVGLGEATHGTKEFFQMKHRIFQYLVENHGFKAFLFEMDLAEALFFENWIQGEITGDLNQLMRNKMIFWTWRTEEVAALFSWMKDYNEGKAEEDRIHLYGVDNQYTRYSLDALVSRLNQVNPTLADSVRIFNSSLKQIHDLYKNKDNTALANINEGIASTLSLLEREKDNIQSQTTDENFLWINRLARHMEQVSTYLYEYYFLSDFKLRDKFMAENSSWYSDLLGADAKFVLWAHNAHMAKNQFYGTSPSQGGHLRNSLRKDYQVIAFGFTSGSFTAYGNGSLGSKRISEDPPRDTYNFIFHNSTHPNFMIDMTRIEDSNLQSWFLLEKRFLQLGSFYESPTNQFYLNTPLTSYYDYLIYFDQTTHSVLL
ncbi:MAG: erythromycin esterase family protein [Bacteroidia bacterium]|nr:erythromycin esterase family protein [Bacteroidia bacterium]